MITELVCLVSKTNINFHGFFQKRLKPKAEPILKYMKIAGILELLI